MGAKRPDKNGSEGGGTLEPLTLRWWPVVAALPVLVGALWLFLAAWHGVSGLLFGVLPGVLLLGTGLSNLLLAVNPRIFQCMSIGAALGVILALPDILVFGPVAAGALLVGSGASFLATGYLALARQPVPSGVPEPVVTAKLAVNAAWDEAAMAAIVLTSWPLAVGQNASRIRREMDAAHVLFEERGWLRDPAGYHRMPPPLDDLEVGRERGAKQDFDHLVFESRYAPWPGEPGRERWLSYENNRTAHAYEMRHPGEPRPWLVCVHGIRMGSPGGGFKLFRPDHLHHELGLNLLLPILPIHGPRRVGPVSGDRILSGDVMDSIHAGAQAIWDIRRLILWLKESENAPAVGVLGESLGGYVAALLASLEDGLDCVAVCNPAVDPSRLFWSNALSVTSRHLRSNGVTEASMGELMRPVSPLALRPLVPKQNRAIFAGVADRVVTAAEANVLWHHWDRPRIEWFQGTHRGFLSTPQGRAMLAETLAAAGIV